MCKASVGGWTDVCSPHISCWREWLKDECDSALMYYQKRFVNVNSGDEGMSDHFWWKLNLKVCEMCVIDESNE